MSRPTTDPLLTTTLLRATHEPQRLIWTAMHCCYAPVASTTCKLAEDAAGHAVVKHLLAGGKGHYSPLEQAHMSLHLAYVPHDVMQQLTRHRLLSFSVQSFRYTSQQFEAYTSGDSDELERLVYLRQPGEYVDRSGNRYTYSTEQREQDATFADCHIRYYQQSLKEGYAPEQARGLLPFNIRQNLVVGGNLRVWLHVLDLRLKADAQPEIQQLSQALSLRLSAWCPQVVEWYLKNRGGKAILSP